MKPYLFSNVSQSCTKPFPKPPMAKLVPPPPYSCDGIILTDQQLAASFQWTATATDSIENYQLLTRDPLGSAGSHSNISSDIRLIKHRVTSKIVCLRTIKRIDLDPKAKNGLELQQKLIHPHVLQIARIFYTPTLVHVLSEYFPNTTLRVYLSATKAPLSEYEAGKVFAQICDAIHFLHTRELAHGGLVPENIILFGNSVVKLAGFENCSFCGCEVYIFY